MKRGLAACSLALLLPALAGAATTSVIVELEADPGAVWRAKQQATGLTPSAAQLDAYRDQLLLAQDQLLARAQAAGLAVAVDRATVYDLSGAPQASFEHRYTLLYNGMTVSVPVEQTAALAALSGVKKLHRVRMLEAQLDRSVPYVRAPQLYGAVPELGPFDDLREGFEGQGINVAVIDTGIEWHHEMFGADVTPPRLGIAPPNALINNRKVIYYIPFGDLAVEDGVGHGTHVASTAAGYRGYTAGPDGLPLTGDDVAIHGVAPQAKIMAYAVCANVISSIGSLTGAIGGCLNSNTILSLEDAVSPRTLTGYPKPVAQVINLSLGGAFGSPDDPTAVASSNAALMGATVVAAAGNAGDVAGIVGSPSTGRRVISVAAATDPGLGAIAMTLDPLDAAGNRLAGAPVINATRAPESNAAQPYNGGITGRYVYAGLADTPTQVPASVAGNICLVERGSTVTVQNQGSGLYANKAAQCRAKGAVAMVAFNNVDGEIGSVLAPSPILVVTISRAAGLYLRDTLGFDAAGISNHRIRLNAPVAGTFTPAQAGFSSRGPVAGWGQVKPDLSAPGVAIVAAVPPASLMGALGATAHGPSYADAQGTSMATPHVAGAAALVKQANPTWHPDYVRAALMNTATPFRQANGQPLPYGPSNEKINAQGAGLIDVAAAARAKALMGVRGDGIVAPFLLASHSFGRVPLLGNECTSSHRVSVDLVDLRGTGGTYQLRAYANRNTDGPGVSFLLPGSVTVPAGGRISFETGVAVDGNSFGGASLVELQWFVVAERSDGSEKLAMPFYLRAIPSAPGAGIGGLRDEVLSFAGTIPGGTPAVVFQANHAVTVPLGTLRIAALLEGDELVSGELTELELLLIHNDGTASGTVVASSSVDGNREYLEYTLPAPGSYTVRPRSQTGGPVSYDLTVTLTRVDSPGPASLAAIATEHVEQGGAAVDFDGAFTLSWTASGRETGFAVEQQVGGGGFQRLALLPATARNHAVSGLADGSYAYRVVAHYPGAICTYVAAPSNVRAVRVAHRTAVDASGSTAVRISRAQLSGGVFEVDFTLTNNGTQALLNPVQLAIVGIQSSATGIRVINADNGGGGTSAADPATFSYSAEVGQEALAPGETSAPRTARFANPDGELFSVTVRVTGYHGTP